jgi:hypothetical protein
MPSPETLQIELRAYKLTGALLLAGSAGLTCAHLFNSESRTLQPLQTAFIAVAYAAAARALLKKQRKLISYANTTPSRRDAAYFMHTSAQCWGMAAPLAVSAADGFIGPLNSPVAGGFALLWAAMATNIAYVNRDFGRSLAKQEAELAVLRAKVAAQQSKHTP